MRSPVLAVPVVIAAILIVYGRVNRRRRWGTWIAVAGYGLLAITAVVAILARS